MSEVLRALRLSAQILVSAVSSIWFVLRKRRAILLFTHAPDMDPSGRDLQMGPLVEPLVERGERFLEVTWIALDGGLRANLARKRRLCVTYASLAALGRCLGRRRVARAFLRALRPRALVLIDESGSGQLLLRAARELGIRTIGVQHGDFQAHNPQYACAAERGTKAADELLVWSPWFQRRLLRISSIYDAKNTRVTGRMRYPQGSEALDEDSAPRGVRVLVVSESRAGFRAELEPFLRVLRAAPEIELRVLPHPAEGPGAWPAEEVFQNARERALAWSDVTLGSGSSALLEALFAGRPGIVLAAARPVDPSGYVAEGVTDACEEPEELVAQCLAVARGDAERTQARRELVWGGVDGDPVQNVLAAALGPSS